MLQINIQEQTTRKMWDIARKLNYKYKISKYKKPKNMSEVNLQ